MRTREELEAENAALRGQVAFYKAAFETCLGAMARAVRPVVPYVIPSVDPCPIVPAWHNTDWSDWSISRSTFFANNVAVHQ